MHFVTRSSLATIALVLMTASLSSDAWAYCRTSVCGEVASSVCTPSGSNDCGVPLFWSPPCIGFSVQENASAFVDVDTAVTIMEQAFQTWEAADCGGSTPAINVTHVGTVSCDQTEYNTDNGNANVVVFRDTGWPYAAKEKTLALTTVTFNLDTGEIFDADLEINASDVQLTTGNNGVEYDLLSIVTHEAGHMLGIAHSPIDEATMTVDYVPGDLSLRDLHPDDVAAICDAYPGGALGQCDPTPRHGFAQECQTGTSTDSDGDCSCATPGHEGDPLDWSILALCGIVLTRRRRSDND
jgi:MYXO-CTERM domain-containing protein